MITKIVLTGGPCGGKTEALKFLKSHFIEDVEFESIATHLLQSLPKDMMQYFI